MVKSCAAYGCTNRFSKDSSISFHRFPVDNHELCMKWIVAMKRDRFAPTKYSYICSSHFTPGDYRASHPGQRRQLKTDAVPSTFSFPDRLIQAKPKRKLPLKRPTNMEIESPSKRAKELELGKQNIHLQSEKQELLRTKVKALSQKLRRRDRKISPLNNLVRT